MTPDQLAPKAIGALPPVFKYPVSVRFQDVDAAGIVFFARVFDYFHDGYVAYLEARGLPLHAVLASSDWGLPIRHAEADYLGPIRFGDTVDVELVGATVEGGDMCVAYRLMRTSGAGPVGKPLAVGHTRHVVVSRAGLAPKRRDAPTDLTQAMQPLIAALTPPPTSC